MLLIDFKMIVRILNLSEFAEWKKNFVLCKDRAFPQLPRTYSHTDKLTLDAANLSVPA